MSRKIHQPSNSLGGIGEVCKMARKLKRDLAKVKEKMGTHHILHKESTFESRSIPVLEDFKARRIAERIGLAPRSVEKVVERFELDVDTGKVTQLAKRRRGQ